jgi:hypothetical protein
MERGSTTTKFQLVNSNISEVVDRTPQLKDTPYTVIAKCDALVWTDVVLQ